MTAARNTLIGAVVTVLLAGCGTSTPASARKHTDAWSAMMAACVLTEHQPRAWCAREVPRIAARENVPIWQ